MKQLKKFEFHTARPQSKYPWDAMFDGAIYQLTEGTDYECSTRNMGGKVRAAAKKRYKAIRIQVDEKGKTVTVQATDMTPEQRKVEDARRAAIKSRRAAFEATGEYPDVVEPCE